MIFGSQHTAHVSENLLALLLLVVQGTAEIIAILQYI